MSPTHRQVHPQDVALCEALGESLDLAKRTQGISAAWVAEYVLKVSPGQLSKYRNPEDLDMLPARCYPLLEYATGNTILREALEAMRPHQEDRQARALSALTALFTKKQGAAMCILIQAMSPDSPDGGALTTGEIHEARPALLELRVLLDELIDSTSEKVNLRVAQ